MKANNSVIVRRVDTGEIYEVEIPVATSIQTFKQELCSVGIAFEDQILLLSDGKKLEEDKNLESYGFPSESLFIVLFNRNFLDVEASESLTQPLSIPEPDVVQVAPKLSYEQSLNANPLVDALRTYEQQFRFHLQKTKSFKKSIEQRIEILQKLLTEQETRAIGHSVAVLNLGDHMNQLGSAWSSFSEPLKKFWAQDSSLLLSFETDVQKVTFLILIQLNRM
jgi:hypothetical protein